MFSTSFVFGNVSALSALFLHPWKKTEIKSLYMHRIPYSPCNKGGMEEQLDTMEQSSLIPLLIPSEDTTDH